MKQQNLLRKSLIASIIVLFLCLTYLPITNAKSSSYTLPDHGIGFIHIRGFIKDLEFIDKNHYSYTSIRVVGTLFAITNYDPYIQYHRGVSKNEKIDFDGKYYAPYNFGIVTEHYINMFYYDIF